MQESVILCVQHSAQCEDLQGWVFMSCTCQKQKTATVLLVLGDGLSQEGDRIKKNI